MKVWFVLEANNLESEIYISKPFYSEKDASEHLSDAYEEILNNEGEDRVESVFHNNTAYSIMTYGSDYYYGVVRSVDIDKFVAEPGDKLYCVQELKL